MFVDWMAAPAVPLTRLSIAVTTTTRRAASSIARPMSAVLAPSDVGRARELPLGQQLHEGLVGVGGLPRCADLGGRDALERVCAVVVARMPRDIGTSTGVNEIGDALGARDRQVLSDLGDVTMGAADGIRRGGAQDLAREQVRP